MRFDLKRVVIHGLNGEKDVDVLFEDSIKILVAENGSGKTTALNCVYGVLSGNLRVLDAIDFKYMEFFFLSGLYFKYNKRHLDNIIEAVSNSRSFKILFDRFEERVLNDVIGRIISFIVAGDFSKDDKMKFIFTLRSRIREETEENVSSNFLIDLFDDIVGFYLGESGPVQNRISFDDDSLVLSEAPDGRKYFDFLKLMKKYNIFYLPTYRRVEFNKKYLASDGKDRFYNFDFGIEFDMAATNTLINKIENNVKDSSVQWLSKVAGDMLREALLSRRLTADEELVRLIDPEIVKIALGRVGDNLEHQYKERIFEIISNGDNIFNKENEGVLYFLSNLIKVYEKQKDQDLAMQSFTSVCNKYLRGKKFVYNESAVDLSIFSDKGKELNLDILSSGEKQIISLFAKLYLSQDDNFLIFFDEPELSLSIEWQMALIPDILASKKCAFLFATTHSPFIFKDLSLMPYVSDLADHTTYIEV